MFQELFFGLMVLFVGALLIRFSKRDDTDTPDGERSGLVLYTDYKTGVQYVGTGFSSPTRRLNGDGSVCNIYTNPARK